MRISVRLFAGLREQAGFRERSLELPDGATVADIWALLELGEEPAGLLYAVNRGYANRAAELSDGDEVALIPPVSGGAFLLSETPLSHDDVVREGDGFFEVVRQSVHRGPPSACVSHGRCWIVANERRGLLRDVVHRQV